MKYFLAFLLFPLFANGQAVPAEEENIPFLVTFGKSAVTSWGDDDHVQTFFFVLPEHYVQPFFLRVFDPETGGAHDELKGEGDTRTSFSVFGGKGAITNEDARKTDPAGNYKSGNLIATETFGAESKYDDAWFTFGPFNPLEGELSPRYGGRIFKLIAEGLSGNDGNLYRYFMSTSPDKNISIEGGNAFTFEYSFRMHDEPRQVSHIYPFLDNAVISVRQANFDFDNDGFIRMVSVARKGEFIKSSDDNAWAISEHPIDADEKGTSLDLQFIKKPGKPAKNNNVVFYITNQYGEFLPFYTVPIGGVPKYRYSIGAKPATGE